MLGKLIGEGPPSSAQIATRLLKAFGSIGGVLCADPLARVHDDPNMVERRIGAQPALFDGPGKQTGRIAFDLNDATFQRWIVGLFRGHRRERIHIALLDRARHLVFDEHLSDGELGKVEGSLRHIVRRGIGLNASGVVLMHNHPSGDARPSAADIEETRRIAYVLINLDMRLEDHLIVAGNRIFSMRGGKLL
ncbi:MAG: JAB domain-containing protein [Erythrobacter sp.]|nr:JAB domain-containing protein [Erythrobacter sp.]